MRNVKICLLKQTKMTSREILDEKFSMNSRAFNMLPIGHFVFIVTQAVKPTSIENIASIGNEFRSQHLTTFSLGKFSYQLGANGITRNHMFVYLRRGNN